MMLSNMDGPRRPLKEGMHHCIMASFKTTGIFLSHRQVLIISWLQETPSSSHPKEPGLRNQLTNSLQIAKVTLQMTLIISSDNMPR